MKRLSISLPAISLVLVLALSGTAFTTAPATAGIASSPHHAFQNVPFLKPTFALSYYFFWASDDTYNDYGTAAYEEWELGQFYYPGVEIDTNPMGGTPVMNGYQFPNHPHVAYPSIYLYAHFVN